MRILIAAAAGQAFAATLHQSGKTSKVVTAADRRQVLAAVSAGVRFDVVIADLIWSNPYLEYSFDGLDVVELLATMDPRVPILVAAHGYRIEQDHLDEALLSPAVAGVVSKSMNAHELLPILHATASGKRRIPPVDPQPVRPLYEYFQGRRGITAAKMAGVIAAGRVGDAAALARAAAVGLNTANKVTSSYLGPLIIERGEHDPSLPLTLASVYRWCGMHSRYLVSWCRRNGYADLVRADDQPLAPPPQWIF
ncbi:response regulator [Nocardia crassostreae]|uniref:response regulator n=1 Tax=Nocardia crassostreae TaxID=53428 RepID=UPI000B09BBF0|nr:response regulator [Nocardia crassostreae]